MDEVVVGWLSGVEVGDEVGVDKGIGDAEE